MGRFSCAWIAHGFEPERATEEREYAPLERIADGYPKYLLTCDRITQRRSGIYHEFLPRFVAEDKRFLHQV